MNRKYTPELVLQMQALYTNGYGQRRIGKKLRVPWQSIWPFIKHIRKEQRTILPTRGVILPIPKSAHQMTCAKARIIGYLMADGCVFSTTKKSLRKTCTVSYPAPFIGFYNKDIAVIEQFIADCKNVYNFEAKYNSKKLEVRIYRNRIFTDLQRYGPYGTFDWKIPAEILKGQKKFKQEWLKAFFDSEATVQVKHPKIILYSANKKGLEQIQTLLREFSIVGRINGPYAGAFRLTLEHSQLLAFYTNIGFYHSVKQEKLASIFLI